MIFLLGGNLKIWGGSKGIKIWWDGVFPGGEENKHVFGWWGLLPYRLFLFPL